VESRKLIVAGRPIPTVGVVAVVVLVAVAVVVGAILIVGRPSPAVVAVASPTPKATPTPRPTPTPTPSPSPSPTPTPSPTPVLRDAVLGVDGRLTVLLLGSDARPSHPGTRTDVMMVVSVDPTTGVAAAASIPRDVVDFPTSSSGAYRAKINGLYQDLLADSGRTAGPRRLKDIIGAGIGVEIDYYALVGFEGVRQLVNAVGGVDVVLDKAVNDPSYWVTSKKRGVHFPAGRNHLDGNTALIFARTRKGDNDFERARRQQLLVAAAITKVREQGVGVLPKLIGLADRWIKTDIPLRFAPGLFEVVTKADLAGAERVVFGPRTWATSTGGTSFRLNLPRVREWTAANMGPVAPAAR
jgi:polyisoprenyl-teichoic acid--peptidoglycan teichoic acid transferase